MIPDYDRAATLAALTLKKLEIESVPVHPETVIPRCRNTRLYRYKDFCDLPGVRSSCPEALTDDHPEALTIRYALPSGSAAWIVYYDPKMMPGDRQRFSLAHELGHIVMDHKGTDPAEELEADFFAAHLLIPRPVIADLLERNKAPFEVNFTNLFNVSRACLYTLQNSHDAHVAPTINRALRAQFAPFVERFCESEFCWEEPAPFRTTRYVNTRCYMQGYRE